VGGDADAAADRRLTPQARRLGWIAGGGVIAISAAIVVLGRSTDELQPPLVVSRALVSAVLLAAPGLIGMIGVATGRRPVLVAAGVLCLFQSWISFSGVTLAYLVPALVFLRSAADGSRSTSGPIRPIRVQIAVPRVAVAAAIRGVGIVVVVITSWFASFAMTETTCWVGRGTPGGDITWERIPPTNTLTLGPGDVVSTCGSGTPTLTAVIVAGGLLLAALGVAGAPGLRSHPARDEGSG
jgi:hypothetical protein